MCCQYYHAGSFFIIYHAREKSIQVQPCDGKQSNDQCKSCVLEMFSVQTTDFVSLQNLKRQSNTDFRIGFSNERFNHPTEQHYGDISGEES